MVCRISTKWSDAEIWVRMSTTATRWSRSRSSSARRSRRRPSSSVASLRDSPDCCSTPMLVIDVLHVGVEFGAVEADDPVAAERLGDVERVVGSLDQLVAMTDPRVRPGGHTAAQRPVEQPALEPERMSLYLLTRPLREGHRGVEHRAGQNDHELLAAVPANAVDVAGGVPQERGELLQHLVPHLMSVGVVDG